MLIKPYKTIQNNSFETMSPEALPPCKLFLSGILSQPQKPDANAMVTSPSSQEKWQLISDWETELDNLKVLGFWNCVRADCAVSIKQYLVCLNRFLVQVLMKWKQ